MAEHAQSPLMAHPGAIAGPWGVPLAYGNTFVEQKNLVSGAALVDLSHHGIVQVSGPDRLSWLDSLLSQKLDQLSPFESTEALLLDPHGHIEYAMRIVDDGQTTWLLVDEGVSAELTNWLERMKFMKQVEIIDASADFATVGAWGELSQEITLVAKVVWKDPWPNVSAGGWKYATGVSDQNWEYSEIVVTQETLSELAHSHDHWAGIDALEAVRIAAWRPRLVTEHDDHVLPHECDWLTTAVHLNKGCYRGQETVAKVHNLGHPPRRLVMLSLDGVENHLPKPGDTVWNEDKEIGKITSAARHFEEGLIALAMIKRSVDTEAELSVHSEGIVIPATQVVIVPPEAGRQAQVPKIPRLGAVTRPTQ